MKTAHNDLPTGSTTDADLPTGSTTEAAHAPSGSKGPTRGLRRTAEEREAKERAVSSSMESNDINAMSQQYATTDVDPPQEQYGSIMELTSLAAMHAPATATNNPLSLTDLPDDLMPQAMPTVPNRPPPTLRPGAYSGNPGCMERNNSLYKGGQRVLGREGDTIHEEDSTHYSLGESNEPPPSIVPDVEDSIIENQHQGAAPTSNHRTTLSNPNISGLVEARMVSQPNLHHDLTQAEQVDPANEERKQREKKQFLWRIGSATLVLACLVAGITVGVVLGTRKTDTEPTHFPTVEPSMPPSETPSSAPTGALDLLLQGLPERTQQSLKNYTTPQWQAWDWLSNHPELPGMQKWRKTQLFALATFYYAMDGLNWPKNIKDNWLRYDEHECYWFTTVFGEFDSRTGKWVELNYYNLTLESNCNRQDEFEFLDLVGLGLSGYKPYIPPEIDLLTSLSILTLIRNEINSSIAEFIPPQLYQMSSLRFLSLGENALTGPIPSELGLLTNVEFLWLHSNSLTGPIPSELGLLTNMTVMHLAENTFAGPIPSEIGLLTNVEFLWLHNNSLTGPIPSELGLLTSMAMAGLNNNSLTGTIPEEVNALAMGDSLVLFALEYNDLSGVVPEEVCPLGMLNWTEFAGVSFDCNDKLCGCEWCPCA